jgi:hypothetical protein
MNATIARKLLNRLENGGYITAGDRRALTNEPPDPFFTEAQIEREAIKVRDGILGMLHLQRMPTEFDVALATVFYLADRNVTGETFHPSGGLRFERTVTEGELFGKPGRQRLERMAGSVVYLIGEHLRQHLLLLARTFLDEIHVARVVLLTETEQAAAELAKQNGYRTPRPQIVFEGNAPGEGEKNDRLRNLLTTPLSGRITTPTGAALYSGSVEGETKIRRRTPIAGIQTAIPASRVKEAKPVNE